MTNLILRTKNKDFPFVFQIPKIQSSKFQRSIDFINDVKQNRDITQQQESNQEMFEIQQEMNYLLIEKQKPEHYNNQITSQNIDKEIEFNNNQQQLNQQKEKYFQDQQSLENQDSTVQKTMIINEMSQSQSKHNLFYQNSQKEIMKYQEESQYDDIEERKNKELNSLNKNSGSIEFQNGFTPLQQYELKDNINIQNKFQEDFKEYQISNDLDNSYKQLEQEPSEQNFSENSQKYVQYD